MPHLSDLTAVHLDQPSLVTVGVFDGVHRGHQTLISQLVTEARSRRRLAVALTFFPHPDVFFHKTTGRYYLTTPDERAALLIAAGIDYVITLPFDDALRHIRAADFVRQFRDHLRLEALWVGADFALGYKREGNVEFLRAAGARDGFTVQTIDLLSGAGSAGGAGSANGANDAISSTAIRAALAAGDVTAAADLLGRAYTVTGEVVHGQARGRTIGFPTANLHLGEYQPPAAGVYAVRAGIDKGATTVWHDGVANFGRRPTFDGGPMVLEVHLLDHAEDLYGRHLRVALVDFIRPERRFDGVAALKAQIAADADQARTMLSSRHFPESPGPYVPVSEP